MQHLKKLFSLLLCLPVMLGIAACGRGQESSSEEIEKATPVEQTSDSEELLLEESSEIVSTFIPETTVERDSTLVVVFSATGTTKGIAEKIAAQTGADLYEITAFEPYTDEDRDYKNSDSRCAIEQNDPTVRPQIGSEPLSLDRYKTIYIGYPIWFGEEPRIMDTFVESYDFTGITVIPFCTSGSSGIGESGHNLATLAGSGNWLEGERFGADATDEEISAWVGAS